MNNYKFGQMRVKEQKINYITAKNIGTAFLNMDKYVYINFTDSVGNYIVAFDESKFSNKKIMKLIDEMYDPFAHPKAGKFGKYYKNGEGYKIPHYDFDKLLKTELN